MKREGEGVKLVVGRQMLAGKSNRMGVAGI